MAARTGAYQPWNDAADASLRGHCEAGLSGPQIARTMGRSLSSINGRAQRLGLRIGQKPADSETAPASASDAVVSPLAAQPITLDELLALFGLAPEEWEAFEATPNVWHVGAKHPETGDIITAPLYQLKARVRRKVTDTQDAWRGAILADIQQDTRHRPRFAYKTRQTPEGERVAVEVCLMDLHVGKLAWGEETGTDYDTQIAERIAKDAVADLLWQAERYAVERFILPVGNDFYHYDNALGTTTSGTPQDRDTRLLKMFRRGRGVASWMIDTLAARAPVEVVVVTGNHAAVLELMLGEVLAAEFAHDPRVTVDNAPTLRKYVQYGKNLIGFTHGNEEPHGKLPQIMAVERPQLWAETTHREYHLGHIHKQKTTEPVTVDDQTGVTVRILRSLSGTDAWHAKRGYVGNVRGAEAFVWRHTGGLRAHLFTYPSDVPSAA